LHEGSSPDGSMIRFIQVVLGGTLGIFLATALQLRGKSVAVVEQNRLVGREQEWNISRADMQVFWQSPPPPPNTHALPTPNAPNRIPKKLSKTLVPLGPISTVCPTHHVSRHAISRQLCGFALRKPLFATLCSSNASLPGASTYTPVSHTATKLIAVTLKSCWEWRKCDARLDVFMVQGRSSLCRGPVSRAC